jgi:nucleotide-binding universal stress UspA family protein
MSGQEHEYQFALQDFRRARRKASLEKIFAFITGKSADLLSYKDVRKQLHLTRPSGYSLKQIPLDAIVGSVNRYNDFTRNFLSLVVVAVRDDHVTSETLSFARGYLSSHRVNATFIQKSGAVSDIILKVAKDHQCDLIMMGGYGNSPILEAVIGSTLDHVLRHSRFPILICR